MVLVKACEDVDWRFLEVENLKRRKEAADRKINGLSSVSVAAKTSCLKVLLYSVIYKITDVWRNIKATCTCP